MNSLPLQSLSDLSPALLTGAKSDELLSPVATTATAILSPPIDASSQMTDPESLKGRVSNPSIEIHNPPSINEQLWKAALKGQWDLVKSILEENEIVNVNIGLPTGGLHKETSVLWFAINSKQWDLVTLMLAKDAEVNASAGPTEGNDKGKNVLWIAAAHPNWDLVALLLARDANVDVNSGAEGRTVIWLAALWSQWDLVARMLARDAKANINTSPVEGVHRGKTPLWFAAAFMQWDLVKWMLRNSERPDVNAAPEQEPNEGETVLWYAAKWKKWDLVKWMLEIDRNANVYAAPAKWGNKGKSVLWYAIASEEWEIIEKMGKPTPPSFEKFCHIASKTNQLIQSQIKETIQKIPSKHRKSKIIVSQIEDLYRGVEDVKTSIYRVKKKIKAYSTIKPESIQSMLDKAVRAQMICKTKLSDLGKRLQAFKNVPSEFIIEVTEETLEKKGRIKLEKKERTKREIEQVKGKREQSLKDMIVQIIGNDHPSTEEIFQSFILRYEREDCMAIGQLSANLAAPARASNETLPEMTPVYQLMPNKIRRTWEQNCSLIEEELSYKLGLLAQQTAAIREIESSFKMALGDIESIVSPYKENIEKFCRQVEERTGFQIRSPDDRPADETTHKLQDLNIEVIKHLQKAEGTWYIDAALTHWESKKIKILEDLNERVEMLKVTFKKRVASLFDFLSEDREETETSKSSVTSSSEETSSPSTSPRPESSHVAGKAEQSDASEEKIVVNSGTHILQIKEEILSVLDAFLESKMFPAGMTEHDMTNLRAMINGIDNLKRSDQFVKLLLALRYELSHSRGGHSHYSQKKDDYQEIEGQTTHFTLAESTVKKKPQAKRLDLAKKALLIVKKWKNDLTK